MRSIVVLILIALGGTAFSSEFGGLNSDDASTAQTSLSSLAPMRWQHRIIIVLLNESDHDSIQQQFAAQHAGVIERDIRWFMILSRTSDTRGVEDEHGAIHVIAGGAEPNRTLSAEFAAQLVRDLSLVHGESILIGKDGGLKAREPALDLRSFFRQIDAMPMRRLEMAD